MNKKEQHERLINNIHEMYVKKNADYGSSFDLSLDEFGLVSSAIRMTDKLNRFKQLIDNDGLVKDEKLEDTLLDLANYAIMTVMWLENENEELCESGEEDSPKMSLGRNQDVFISIGKNPKILKTHLNTDNGRVKN